MKRAEFTGRAGSRKSSEYSASSSGFAYRMSSRPLPTNAGIASIASTTRRTLGRTWVGVRGLARRPLGVRRPDEVEQVGVLRLVELERAAHRLEDVVRDAARVAALEAGVVLDADAREQRDLLAAEAGDAARAPERRAGRPAPARGGRGGWRGTRGCRRRWS